MLLLFSVAFCDYMTSGLENPLSYFLVGLLLWLLAADGRRQWIFLVLALLVLNRFDFAALFLPLALLLVFARTNHSPLEGESVKQGRLRPQLNGWGVKLLLRDICPGFLLLTAWLLFALIYFGSPLPNSFYAKMASGYPLEKSLERAMDYFSKTAAEDPISLAIIAAGVLLSLFSGSRVLLALAAGQLLYLGFIITAGGDWMPSGRFFSVPVFLAVGQMVFVLSHRRPADPPPARRRAAPLPLRLPLKGGVIRPYHRWPVGGLLLLALGLSALPRAHDAPLFAATGHFQNEVRVFHATTRERWGVFGMPRSDIKDVPPQRPSRYRKIGWMGSPSLQYPDLWLIDIHGLTDPFLARLPGQSGRWSAGHHERRVPTDYGEFLLGKMAVMPDENLHGLARDLALATRSPALFTGPRLAAIWRLNTGYHSGLDLSRYADPASDIPFVSDNARFFVSLNELGGYITDGHPLHAFQRSRFFGALQVTADKLRLGTRLQLSLSYMEDYEIRVNGELVATIDRVGPEGKMKNHTVPLPRPTLVETIEIRAMGRHWNRAFSIGHLHIR